MTPVQIERLSKLAAAATELMTVSLATLEKMCQFEVPVVYSRHYTKQRHELGSALANINLALASSKGTASDLTAELKGAIEASREAETKIATLIDDMMEMGVKPYDCTNE